MVSRAYKNYLRSERWQRKRQQVFAKYGKRCMACGTARGPIQVQHISYAHIFNEPLEDLRVLCAKCHREITAIEKRAGRNKNRLLIFNTFVRAKRQRANR